MDSNTIVLVEMFYRALSHWRHYPLTLLGNRLQTMEAIAFYARKLVTAPLHHTLLLQGEVNDEVGTLFKEHDGDDVNVQYESVTAAKQDATSHHQTFTAQEITVIGVYIFALLNDLAGLSESNNTMRNSAIDCLEKLFCTPRTALRLSLVAMIDGEEDLSHCQGLKECSLRLLTSDALRVRDILVKGRWSNTVAKTQLSPLQSMLQKVRKQCKKQVEKSSLQVAGECEMEFENIVVWRHDHPYVGMPVSKEIDRDSMYYQLHTTKKKRILSQTAAADADQEVKQVVHGRVTGYLPLRSQVATRHNLNIFKVEFEDGSVSEFYDAQLRDAEMLYNKMENWTRDHELINANIAKYFFNNVSRKKQCVQSQPQLQLFRGRVTKYSPALEGESVELFHIEYEDGDQEDMDYDELKTCIELYDQHFSI